MKEGNGLTTADLATMYSEAAGSPGLLKPTTLNNLLAGKRKSLTIGEIITFAFALNVAPIALIVPLFEQGEITGLPMREMAPIAFYEMFTGESRWMLKSESPLDESEAWSHVFTMLRAYLGVEQRLRNEIGLLGLALTSPESVSLPASVIEGRRRQIVKLADELGSSRDNLREWNVDLLPLDKTLNWLEHLAPDEITLEAIEESWVEGYSDMGREPDESAT